MISIIIPVYNGAEWIEEAVESAVKQFTCGELFDKLCCPLIIVDDGSTDSSLEIIKKYQIDYPQLKIISQVNKGLASARNTGIMNSKSEYCLFLDADDILLDDCILKIQNKIEETDADIITASFKEFGLSDREVILMSNPTIEDFKTGNRIGYCAAIRRSALLEIGGYSPRMTFGYEDYHLWFDLLTRGKQIVTIPEVLWMYRTKEKSMITEAQKHHEELMAQIRKDFPNEFR